MKYKILLIAGIQVLLFTFSNFSIAEVQNAAVDIYKDKKLHFTFSTPAGWVQEGVVAGTVSQVNFRSPDGKAGLSVVAQLNKGELDELFAQKKDYVKDFQRRFPKGKFVLSWGTLGERKVIKINFEIPSMIKQEQYFFFDQGVRFDLVYGVVNAADFGKNRQAALDAFGTIQRQKI